MAGFFFQNQVDPTTGLSPQSIERKRAMLAQLLGGGTPQNTGEGLGAILKGIASGIQNNRLDRAESAGVSRAQSKFDAIKGFLMGGPSPAGATSSPQQGMPAMQPSDNDSNRPTRAGEATMPASLIRTESGGKWGAQNAVTGAGGAKGHFGRAQFGIERMREAEAAGAIPKGTTPQQFMASPEMQMAAESWHFGDIDEKISRYGADKMIGQKINGITVTRDGLRAMAHLGGTGGMTKFVQSGGRYNPSDAYGTSLSDYLRTHQGDTRLKQWGQGESLPAPPELPVMQANATAGLMPPDGVPRQNIVPIQEQAAPVVQAQSAPPAQMQQPVQQSAPQTGDDMERRRKAEAAIAILQDPFADEGMKSVAQQFLQTLQPEDPAKVEEAGLRRQELQLRVQELINRQDIAPIEKQKLLNELMQSELGLQTTQQSIRGNEQQFQQNERLNPVQLRQAQIQAAEGEKRLGQTEMERVESDGVTYEREKGTRDPWKPAAGIAAPAPKRDVQIVVDPNTGRTIAVDKNDPNMSAKEIAPGRTSPKFDDVSSLRKEIGAVPEVKRYSEALPAYNTMVKAVDNETAAGDLAFVYGLAKVFDPDSVVREGEMQFSQGAQSMPERVMGTINSVVSGQTKLTRETKAELVQIVNERMLQMQQQYDERMEGYSPVFET
ncbi:MAG: hypothetical protein ACRCU5_03560, partial [Rhizobiaceae bacterium]